MSHQMRKDLSAQGMYSTIRAKSLAIPDGRQQRASTIPQSDAVMSAVAMFAFKSPSMLQFFDQIHDLGVRGNLQRLFDIGFVPGDTAMREILDPIATSDLNSI